MNNAHNETTPWHIWFDAVCTELAHKGLDGEAVRAQKPLALKWYQAGEPVWMAVSGLALVVRQTAIATRADNEARCLRNHLKSARKQPIK